MKIPVSRDVGMAAPGLLVGGVFIWRALAVVDAVALQALLLWWAWGWPKHGSLVGAVFSGLVAWWALKRVSRALFDFPNYRWLAWTLLKLLLVAWLIQGAAYLAS
jgi:hypothetical protein